MTNNESTLHNSGPTVTDGFVKDIYDMTDRLETIVNNNHDNSDQMDTNQRSDTRLEIKDCDASAVTDEIPEEEWEDERGASIPRPAVYNRNVSIVEPESTPSKGLGAIELCFGYRLSQFKWLNLTWLVTIHIYAIYAYAFTLLFPVKTPTVAWAAVLACFSGFGVSAGAHRLWAHRAFKARWLLKLFLVILETMAVNGSCFSYARDHRNHHKFVDTNADPKNARRGFFFAHIGWWCVKKNEQVIIYGRKLSHKDLLDDTLIVIQHKAYVPLVILWAIIFPVLLPYFAWKEDLLVAFNVCVVLRIVFVLHHLFTVNSIAHIFGKRPYDKNIGPTESKLTMYLSLGEGSHNYHHSFPMDYANCEKKWWEVFNPSTLFIDSCELLGLAYDLKKPTNQVVQGMIQRKGDPEYFERKMKRGLCTRITLGFIDYVFGFLVALWPVWLGMAFKLVTGRPTFML